MRKLSNVCTALLCAVLLLVCAVPARAEEGEETKTTSLDVMLMVDDTFSMQRNDPNHIATLALQRFVERMPGKGSRIGIATFDDDILTSTSSLTDTDQPMMFVNGEKDRERLKEYAEAGLTQRGSYTDLPCALYYAVEQIQKLQPMDSAPAIIVVSDGENDYSSTAAQLHSEEMLEKVRDAGIPVYLIVIQAGNKENVRAYMQDIADDTGGKALFVDSGDEIDSFLVDIVNEICGLQPLEDILTQEIGPEPEDWIFSLPKDVFEANVELTHEMELDKELFGPDGTQIPLEGNPSISVSSVRGKDSLKTIVRLMEPDEGDYIMRLSSPFGNQLVIGEIILNNEIYVQVKWSFSQEEQDSDTVEVIACLMRGGEQYENLKFANLEASLSVDGGQAREMQRDDTDNVFRYLLTVPDQNDTFQVVVTVRGQRSFLRSSDPVKIEVKQSDASDSTSDIDTKPGQGNLIWVIILLVVLLLVIILLATGWILRMRGSNDKHWYICPQGTLTVTYFDDAHQYMWNKTVDPGTYYSKNNPHVSLGKMLRDQKGYEEIPEYFDMLQIAEVQYDNGRLCIEVTGEFNTSSGSREIKECIPVNNGRSIDEMDSMDFFGSMSSARILFPDNTQTELEFAL